MVILRDHSAKEKKRGMAAGVGGLPELVFNHAGGVLEQNTVRRIYDRILQKAGLRLIKLHGLRHSFASILLTRGASPVYVKEQLGHHSIKMTVDVYDQWIRSDDTRNVNLIQIDPRRPNTDLKAKTAT